MQMEEEADFSEDAIRERQWRMDVHYIKEIAENLLDRNGFGGKYTTAIRGGGVNEYTNIKPYKIIFLVNSQHTIEILQPRIIHSRHGPVYDAGEITTPFTIQHFNHKNIDDLFEMVIADFAMRISSDFSDYTNLRLEGIKKIRDSIQDANAEIEELIFKLCLQANSIGEVYGLTGDEVYTTIFTSFTDNIRNSPAWKRYIVY